jgi:glycosyltransferase involved in cell wall biosynthesis
MPRVALVCEPPDGGVAEHVIRLVEGLPAHGYEPILLVPPEFKHATRHHVTLPFRRDYGHPREDARSLRRIVQVARTADLVHSHSAKAGVLGRLAAAVAGKPAVYTPHGFPFVGEMSDARRKFGVTVERALDHLTDAILCVCEFERDLARTQGLRPKRLEVVHNGCAACPETETAPLPEGPLVGAVSTYRQAKRLDILLAAWPAVHARFPAARLVLAGEGPLEAELKAQAEPLSNVHFIPFEPPSARYLNALDVYVLCSSWESFPIGLLEAMACGVPQVVSAVGGTREAVTEHTGILVPPREPEPLAGAIIELLSDEPRRTAMREASERRHAERFTVDRMVAGTAAVYDRVLKGARPL